MKVKIRMCKKKMVPLVTSSLMNCPVLKIVKSTHGWIMDSIIYDFALKGSRQDKT